MENNDTLLRLLMRHSYSTRVLYSLTTLVVACLSLVLPDRSLASANSYTYLEPYRYNVMAARFTPDSKRIVALGDRGVLIEWNFLQNRIISRRELGKDISDTCSILASDGRWALVADGNSAVVRHDVTNNASIRIPVTLLPGSGDKPRSPAVLASSDDTATIYLADNYGALYRSRNQGAFVPLGPAATSHSHHDVPYAMALSPDGAMLALSKGSTIFTINTTDGTRLATMRHRLSGTAIRLSFSPDSKQLTAGIPVRFDAGVAVSELPIWDAATGRLVKDVETGSGLPFYAGFSNDGKYLFAATNNTAMVIDRKTGKQLASFIPEGSNAGRFDMRESPDGTYLLITGASGLLQVYDYRKLLNGSMDAPHAALTRQRASLYGFTFSPDSRSLLLSFIKQPLQRLDLKTYRTEQLSSTNKAYEHLLFTSDGSRLVGLDFDALTIWSYPAMTVAAHTERQQQVSGFIMSEDSKQLLVLNNRYRTVHAQVMRYDVQNGTLLQKLVLEKPSQNASMNHLLCVDFNNNTAVFQMYNAFLYSVKDGSVLQQFPFPQRPDGYTSDWEEAWRFDCSSMAFVATTPATKGARIPSAPKWHYARSRDKKVTAAMYQDTDGKTDRSVRLYYRNGRETGHFTTFASPRFGNNSVNKLSLSDNGALLAVATEQNDIGIYETATGKLLGRYYFFNDGEWVWVASDGTLHGSDEGKSRLHIVSAGAKK